MSERADQFRDRVRMALDEYESAKAAAERALEAAGDVRALQHAHQVESAALEHYMQALRSLHESVVRGKKSSTTRA